ncbi:hypothetical protein CTAYLR_007373 [Chrysophaeum taylorii]|uniref:Derlin n=1 Tax=Chrysophaeum taylorii TaxID=2483200 RepID=A0AAD7U4Y0_9STRA|nr:hypothetical protein CTAYLR_007373 [Chrysophaeum taylorii]
MARVGRVGDGNGPREWLESLPPITRAWLLASVLTTCLVSFGILPPYRVIWSWDLVWHKFELWRLITPFAFFGGFSFPFLINVYLLVQYSRNYEVAPYNTGAGGTTADYAWMLILGMGILLILSTLMGQPVPSQGLTYMVLYVWSRRNPTMQVSLYGFQLAAVYLPWALLLLNMLIGNPLTVPLMGVFAGHAYYFAVDPLPDKYGSTLVTTPKFVMDLFADGPVGPMAAGPGFRAHAPPGRRDQPATAPRGNLFNRGGGHNWGTGRTLGTE